MPEFQLPTMTSADWTVTRLLDSLREVIGGDQDGELLSLFMYAATAEGWRELQDVLREWKRSGENRRVVAFIGTDHAITEPEALRRMQGDEVEVRVPIRYTGIFHPKVIWLQGSKMNHVWVGSNNVTRDGLLNNIEFATLISSREVSSEMIKWSENVAAASEVLTQELLKDYQQQRDDYAKVRAKIDTFTWRRRAGLSSQNNQTAQIGDLVIEVMPKETGPGGKQVQLPKQAVIQFFGIPDKPGESLVISLRRKGSDTSRNLKMTLYENVTVRLSIGELDYRDRPCVIVFRKLTAHDFEFEIVQNSIFPGRYGELIGLCNRKTNSGSRRWGIRGS